MELEAGFAGQIRFIHLFSPKHCMREPGLSTDYQDTSTVSLVMAMQKKQSSNVYIDQVNEIVVI